MKYQIISKAAIVNNTWAQDCDKYFFISKVDKSIEGQEYVKPFPILQPANFVEENYDMLTDKIYKTYIDVYKKYSDYDWYLKGILYFKTIITMK